MNTTIAVVALALAALLGYVWWRTRHDEDGDDAEEGGEEDR